MLKLGNRKLRLFVQPVVSAIMLSMFAVAVSAGEVTLEKTYKVADNGLYFNGVQNKSENPPNKANTKVLDFAFGDKISAHGDAVKVYKNFIFTTYYKGGKYNRNLMLARYNTETGVVKTIEFPHKHTGFRGITVLGESHNTAAVGISPKDGKIHILYDMHSYNNTQFPGDYFRYSYTEKDAATVPDADFKLSLFVADGPNDYGHNNLNGTDDFGQFGDLTYPTFFLNENDDLLFYMRTGGNNNGGYVFTSYNATTSKWANMTQFNHLNASSKSTNVNHNWGLYGEMKYVNGKLRTAFQTRSANNNDKYQYQNGIFYAYSDDQTGRTGWKTHSGQSFIVPFADPAPLKIYEPGNLVSTTEKNKVYIVGGFDFTVTDGGDVHIVSMVQDRSAANRNDWITKKLHSYKPAGATRFTHTTDFTGGSNLYTFGEDVYIIGLKNGRPYVQKARGGTNNFTTVYEDTSGPKYNHGVLTIHNGKVYYYLQQAKYAQIQASGDSSPQNRKTTSMPLFVQIIDLGLDISEPDPADPVDYTPPPGYEFAANAGQTVQVTGTMNVAFGANGEFAYLENQTANVECSREVFGDPLLGVVKKCFVQAVDVPEVIANDEYCSVADFGFNTAKETFAANCAADGFVFDKCSAVEGYPENWVACSSMPNPLETLHIISPTAATQVEAEDYARAEDASALNKGGAYRTGAVDIEQTTDTDGGYQVGWIADSDVLTYDILVPEAGYYQMTVRSANAKDDLAVAVRLNGEDLISGQALENNGSNTTFVSNTFNLGELAQGSQVLDIQFTGDFKFNRFTLEKIPAPELPVDDSETDTGEETDQETDLDPAPGDDEDFETGTEDETEGEIVTGGEDEVDDTDTSAGEDGTDTSTGGETEQPGTGGETEQPGTGGETEQPGTGGETEQPGTGGETEQPGTGGETEQPGTGGETEQPGTGEDDTDTSTGEQGGNSDKPAADDSRLFGAVNPIMAWLLLAGLATLRRRRLV